MRLSTAGMSNMLAVFVCLVASSGAGKLSPAHGAERIELSSPVDCVVGENCHIQSYVDLQAGPGAVDHRCGSATYDGHKGVDFRVRSAADAAEGVRVLAAAPGVVKGLRDGMRDRLIAPDGRDKSLVAGRECGNGVVIDHGGGWETQYCHLKRGSVVVAKGDRVERGAALGEVGYSGAASFAHLHLSVRAKGAVVDPFSGKQVATAVSCPADQALVPAAQSNRGGLWRADFADKLGYTSGAVIDVGFAGGGLNKRDLEYLRSFPKPGKQSTALVFFARAINMRAGDRLTLTLEGPDGFSVVSRGDPMDRNRALWLSFAGKKLRADSWPSGAYVGEAKVMRGGDVVSSRTQTLNLN
ncbi:MAG: M23 family metallopeptidase [Pseudomonadota bacterium]